MATVNDRAQVQRILIFSQIYSVLIMKCYTKIKIWIFIKLKFFSTIFNYINTRACRFHAAWWACVVVCGGILHAFTRPANICVISSKPYKHTQHNVHSTQHFYILHDEIYRDLHNFTIVSQTYLFGSPV